MLFELTSKQAKQAHCIHLHTCTQAHAGFSVFSHTVPSLSMTLLSSSSTFLACVNEWNVYFCGWYQHSGTNDGAWVKRSMLPFVCKSVYTLYCYNHMESILEQCAILFLRSPISSQSHTLFTLSLGSCDIFTHISFVVCLFLPSCAPHLPV